MILCFVPSFPCVWLCSCGIILTVENIHSRTFTHILTFQVSYYELEKKVIALCIYNSQYAVTHSILTLKWMALKVAFPNANFQTIPYIILVKNNASSIVFSKLLSPVGINYFTYSRSTITEKLTIKTSERRHWGCSDDFILDFEQISHIVLNFRIFELVKVGWVVFLDTLTALKEYSGQYSVLI